MLFSLPKKLLVLVPAALLVVAGAAHTQLTNTLTLHVSPLMAGTMANAASTGSTPGVQVHLFNGSGLGSTMTAYGLVDLDNPVHLVSRTAGTRGQATFRQFIPRSYAGITVHLQAIDDDGMVSQVHIETIL